MNLRAFTYESKKLKFQLDTEVGVADSSISKSDFKRDYKGLWDTGATGTAISEKIVNDLQLVPIGMTTVHSAGKAYQSNQYLVDVLLPNEIIVQQVLVTEALTFDFDLLVGMDIITLGDFCLTNKNGSTIFTFQIPSVKRFDFVKELNNSRNVPKVGRNLPCPCGSGKKYKNCHGK